MKEDTIGTARRARAPLALAAVAFAAGIWLAGHLDRSPRVWTSAAIALIVCALVAVFVRSVHLGQVSAVLAVLAVGALARVDAPRPHVVLPPAEFMNGAPVEIEGHVISDGARLPGGGPRERLDLRTEIIRAGDRIFTEPVGIRATAFSKLAADENVDPAVAEFPRLAYGDRLRFTAKLRPPRNFRNPGAFDYEGYLRNLGISELASVDMTKIEVLPGKTGRGLGFWRSGIRRSILEHMSNPTTGLWNRDDAALFAAMIVGEDSLVGRGVREEFQRTGVYHLLVVSGMNVALLALAVFWLARRLHAPEWAAALATIGLSVFYAYIAGMGVPIQRAVLMLSVFLLARLLFRHRSALNATGFAALTVLAVSPGALFEAGFQLTFLALLAIAGIGVPVLERTSTPYRRALLYLDSTVYDLNLDPRLAQLRLDLRLIIERTGRLIGIAPARWLVRGSALGIVAAFELLAISSVTQAVLVLPMRQYFHRAAIVGLPANLLVLPLAGLMLNAGVAAIALSYIWLPAARVAAWIATAALHGTLRAIDGISRLPAAEWRVPDPGWIVSLIAAAGIVAAVFAIRRQKPWAWSGLALLFASACFAAFSVAPPRLAANRLEITAIDVGQGDSLLVVSPQGRVLLIDGGGSLGPARGEFDFGEDVVSPYLWSRGLERVDVVALTHAHGDHIGGLERVLENFRPRELWVGINPSTPALDRLYAAAAAQGVTVHSYVTGDKIDWGGTQIRVLSPPRDWRPKARPTNDDSLALLLTFGDTRALLAGDVEKKMEKVIAGESPQAELLKVAHHGSATSTTPEMLAAVHPRFAVISVGAHNSFGHPRPVVLERLQDAHVLTYRTDFMGLVTFLLDGKNVEARVGGF